MFLEFGFRKYKSFIGLLVSSITAALCMVPSVSNADNTDVYFDEQSCGTGGGGDVVMFVVDDSKSMFGDSFGSSSGLSVPSFGGIHGIGKARDIIAQIVNRGDLHVGLMRGLRYGWGVSTPFCSDLSTVVAPNGIDEFGNHFVPIKHTDDPGQAPGTTYAADFLSRVNSISKVDVYYSRITNSIAEAGLALLSGRGGVPAYPYLARWEGQLWQCYQCSVLPQPQLVQAANNNYCRNPGGEPSVFDDYVNFSVAGGPTSLATQDYQPFPDVSSLTGERHIVVFTHGYGGNDDGTFHKNIGRFFQKATIHPDFTQIFWNPSNPQSWAGTGSGGVAELLSDAGINIHVVVFNNTYNSAWDQWVAVSGGKIKIYEMQNPTDIQNLVGTFGGPSTVKQVIDTISATAPAISVDENGFLHDNELFFGLGKPALEPFWAGNLKKYKLGASGLVDSNGKSVLDQQGNIKATAQSFWSPGADGADVGEGGAKSQLPSASNRRVFIDLIQQSNGKFDLGDSKNKFQSNNSDLNNFITSFGTLPSGIASPSVFVDWILGDASNSPNNDHHGLNDSLNAQPVVARVRNGHKMVFHADNGGFIHAIDAANGNEQWAFLPKALVENWITLFENAPGEKHPYGVDGQLTVWSNDMDGNGTIDNNDHVYLYFGMRRGGRDIYALNVTNPNQPEFLWRIQGGVTNGFSRLGQTWSRLVKTKVELDGAVREVLVFSGGYDVNQDDPASTNPDTMGNAIYMVDAEDGSLIWSAGPDSSFDLDLSEMTHSIPASPKVLDVNSDGLVDQLYIADTNAQIFRFDITNGAETVQDLVTGGLIAELGGAGANRRKFFHTPDISLRIKGGERKLVLAVGSGDYANPKDIDVTPPVNDYFFVLFLDAVTAQPSSYNVIEKSDLLPQASPSGLLNASNTSGWYYDLRESGEKVVSSSATYGGVIFFTTYTPPPAPTAAASPTAPAAGGACPAPTPGVGRLYAFNVADAQGAIPGSLSASGASTEFVEVSSMMPPQLTRIKTVAASGEVIERGCVGLYCVDALKSEPLKEIYRSSE